MKKLLILFAVLFVLSASSSFGEIKVYDANDDFLGYVIAINQDYEIDVYIPSLEKLIKFVYIPEETDAGIIQEFDIIYFTETDCSGTHYLPSFSLPGTNDGQFRYYIRRHCSKFYALSNDNNDDASILSMAYMDNGCSCTSITGGSTIDAYSMMEVTLPFNYPIELPLRFEYEVESEEPVRNKAVVVPVL